MRRLRLVIAALFCLTLPAAAEEPAPVVVELFTSQGCSSCPPADAFLRELAERDGVIALALHVDYWDYIGWKDSFAQPAFTARQKAYAAAQGRRMVYTPQMIVDGTDHVVGRHVADVEDLIARHAAKAAPVAVEAMRGNGTLRIRARPADGSTGPASVQVVRYRANATVDIRRGENAGRTLSYANIVTDLDVVADWDGAAPLEVSVPITGPRPAVVLIQRRDHGPVLGAARVAAR